MHQLEMRPQATVEYTEDSIQKQFEDFNRENPRVMDLFVQFTREFLATGKKKCGAKMVWERIRWQVYLETNSEAYEVKLPNNFTSRYARYAMQLHPDLKGVFRLGGLRRI